MSVLYIIYLLPKGNHPHPLNHIRNVNLPRLHLNYFGWSHSITATFWIDSFVIKPLSL
jgi:hypothetical protein